MSGSPSVARRAMGRTPPQRPQARAGRGEQAKHRAAPSLALVTTTRTRPHPEHASASWWLRQRGHTPVVPTRTSGRPVRPHTAQAGTARLDPRARSSATSRPTTGGAPARTTAGPACKAAVRWRATAGLVMVASTASPTWSSDSSGQTAATTATIASGRRSPISAWDRPRPWLVWAAGR